jgi:hypothetical protein
MRNGANADICGILKENILIKNSQNGLVCGLIHVLVDDPYDVPTSHHDDNTVERYIPVLLQGASIISQHSHSLKKGARVSLIGKFKVIEEVYVAFDYFGFENVNAVVICIHDKNRLRVVSEDFEFLESNSQENTKVENIGKSVPKSWAYSFN